MTIIGHGDIASVLTDRPDRCYFASGVSNSQETREGEYAREAGLLLAQDPRAHLVYFSSLSIFYANGRYQQHKRFMETTIKRHFPRYCIMRLGNISWGSNPHTLINHMRAELAAGRPLEIQDVYRHVIDAAEFHYWINRIPDWSCEMNCPGRKLTVAQIAYEFVYPSFRERMEALMTPELKADVAVWSNF